MGQSASFPSDVKVVVVGGGYGGSTLALALLKAGANFTLIDCKPVFHHNVASVRAAVVPGIYKPLTIHVRVCHKVCQCIMH